MVSTDQPDPRRYRHPERCIDCGALYPLNKVEGGAVCDGCKARRVEQYGDAWQRDRRPPQAWNGRRAMH